MHTTTRTAARSTARAIGKGFFSTSNSKLHNVWRSWKWRGVVCGAVAAATLASKELFQWTGWTAQCAAQEDRGVGKERKQLPTFTMEEISKHRNLESGVWVTYKDGVYDITEFLPQHPGGADKLMLAAGSAVDPYWQVFAQHNSDQVWEMLEEYRIGNVAVADRTTTETKGGHYAKDPPRSAILKVNTKEPFNAETPPVLLPEEFITPNELFFIRNHLPVPVSEPATYTLEVTMKGLSTVRLTLDDLKTKFPQHTVTATVQCAGNRREELGKVKEVGGISWTGGAIGNATWTGVKLRDILLHAGVSEGDVDGKIHHIHFEGLDRNPLTGECYGASIPIEKAMDPKGDCLLAFAMNGSELPRDHGYPVRALVPGTVGARNVKWLAKIVASDEEYDGQWQQRDYKGFSPSVDWTNVDFSTAPAIQEMPVQSLICSPPEGASFDAEEDTVTMHGLAWSGGGRKVVRVDVSGDGGQSWVEATLKEGQDQKRRRAWAWTLWEATIPLTAGQQAAQLCCKAIDDSYNVQPDTTAPIWNLRGCLSNAWHRVNINRK